MRFYAASLAGLLLTGCSAPVQRPTTSVDAARDMNRPTAVDVGIDHVIVGINDLQRGIDVLEERTGVRAVYGGVHPGGGTHNALVSLGDHRYLELLAPNPQEKVESQMTRGLASLETLTPVGWAIAVRNVERVRDDLQSRGVRLSDVRSGSRARPDGRLLEWVTFGITEPVHTLAPFFIRWSDSTPHPSTTSPTGCTLESFALHDPAADVLRALVEPLGLGVQIRDEARSRISMILSCPRGRVELQYN